MEFQELLTLPINSLDRNRLDMTCSYLTSYAFRVPSLELNAECFRYLAPFHLRTLTLVCGENGAIHTQIPGRDRTNGNSDRRGTLLLSYGRVCTLPAQCRSDKNIRTRMTRTLCLYPWMTFGHFLTGAILPAIRYARVMTKPYMGHFRRVYTRVYFGRSHSRAIQSQSTCMVDIATLHRVISRMRTPPHAWEPIGSPTYTRHSRYAPTGPRMDRSSAQARPYTVRDRIVTPHMDDLLTPAYCEYRHGGLPSRYATTRIRTSRNTPHLAAPNKTTDMGSAPDRPDSPPGHRRIIDRKHSGIRSTRHHGIHGRSRRDNNSAGHANDHKRDSSPNNRKHA